MIILHTWWCQCSKAQETQHRVNNCNRSLSAFENVLQHHTSAHTHSWAKCHFPANLSKRLPEIVFWWDAPLCLWAQSASSQLEWSCWLETPRGDLAKAPDHFNHSSPLTGSQISLCSLGTRRALTNHLPSPSLLYFSLSSLPLSAMMLLNEKRQWGEKIWDWFICFSVLWDGVLSLSLSLSLQTETN